MATEYTRIFSWMHAKGRTEYRVTAGLGEFVGYVAHDGNGQWFADNKRWARADESGSTVGGQLVRVFRRRSDAADALWHIHNGTATPEDYGGYVVREES